MEKAECIKFILSDKDLVRRVKEWISRREDMQQASLAASSFNSMALDNFLTSLSIDDFNQMIQDLDIGKALTASRSCTSSRDGFSSASNHDVPTKLDNDSTSHDNDVEWDMNAMTNLKITPSQPEIKASEITVSRIGDVSSAHRVVFDVYDEDKDEDLKTEAPPMASTWNFPPAPESKIQDTEELNVHEQRNPHKCSNPGEEATAFRSPGSMDMTENSPDSQTSDCSSTEEDGSQQNYVRNEPIPRRTSNMTDPAEQNNAFEQRDHDLRQPSLEASDRSSVVGSSDQSSPVSHRTPIRRALTEDRAREHAYPSPLSGDLYQSDRPSVSMGNYQHSHGPRLENLGDARQSTRFPDQNTVQNPLQQLPAGLQSAAQITFDQLQNRNSPQFPQADVSEAQIKLLKDENEQLKIKLKQLQQVSAMERQLEELKGKNTQIEDALKHLQEESNEDKENHHLIANHFHKLMVERQKRIKELEAEIQMLKNTNPGNDFPVQLYEKAKKLEDELSQLDMMTKRNSELLMCVKEKKKKIEENCQELRNENKKLKEDLRKKEDEIQMQQASQAALYAYLQEELARRLNEEVNKLHKVYEDLMEFARKQGFQWTGALNDESDDEGCSNFHTK